MKTIWNLFSSFVIVGLTIWFIKWYVKGHFGKYAIFFWLYTIIVIVIFLNNPGYNPNWPQHDNRTGSEVWEQTYGKSY
jgi:hypothetical protein